MGKNNREKQGGVMKYYFKRELKKEALKGLKMNYISEQIGYSTPYLYDIFNGKCSANEKLASIICNYLKIKKEDYFTKK